MSLRVMVIDDDEIVHLAIQRIADSSKNGLQITSAEDGQVALNTLKKMTDDELPHVILLDLNMPGIDGFEFLESFKNYSVLQKTVIFILSTSANPKDIDRAYESHIAGYLVKSEQGVCYEKTIKLLESYQEAVFLAYK